MKQKKTKQCEGCERHFSPEGYRAHKRSEDNTGYNACDFYARYIKHLRKNVILTDWDEMEKRFAAT